MNHSKKIRSILLQFPLISRQEILEKCPEANFIDIAVGYFYNDKIKEGLNTLIDASLEALSVEKCSEHLDVETFVFFFTYFNKEDQKKIIYEYKAIFLELSEKDQVSCLDQISYDLDELIEFYDLLYIEKSPPFAIANEILSALNLNEMNEAQLLMVNRIIKLHPRLVSNYLDFFKKLAFSDLAICSDLLVNNYFLLSIEEKEVYLSSLIKENYIPSIVKLLESSIKLNAKQLFTIAQNNHDLKVIDCLNKLKNKVAITDLNLDLIEKSKEVNKESNNLPTLRLSPICLEQEVKRLLKVSMGNPDKALDLFEQAINFGLNLDFLNIIITSPVASFCLLKKKYSIISNDNEAVEQLANSALLVFELGDILNLKLSEQQELRIIQSLHKDKITISRTLANNLLLSRNDMNLISFILEKGKIKEQIVPDLLKQKGKKLSLVQINILIDLIHIPKLANLVLQNKEIVSKINKDRIIRLYNLAEKDKEGFKNLVFYLLSNFAKSKNFPNSIKNKVLLQSAASSQQSEYLELVKSIEWSDLDMQSKSVLFQMFFKNPQAAWIGFCENKEFMTQDEKVKTLNFCSSIELKPDFNLETIFRHTPSLLNSIISEAIRKRAYCFKKTKLVIGKEVVAERLNRFIKLHYDLSKENKDKIEQILCEFSRYDNAVLGKYMIGENLFIENNGVVTDLSQIHIQLIDQESRSFSQKLNALLFYRPIKELAGTIHYGIDGDLCLSLNLTNVDSLSTEDTSPKFNLDSIKELSKRFNELVKINTNRAFGVEIEFASKLSRAKIGRELQKCGIPIKVIDLDRIDSINQKNEQFLNWEIKEDQSIEGDKFGFSHSVEIISPKLFGEDGLHAIKNVLEKLEALGLDNFLYAEEAKVGLHVHHDLSDVLALDVNEQVRNLKERINQELFKIQDPLYLLCAEYRRSNNEYCQRIKLVDGIEKKWQELKVRGGFNFMSNRADAKPTIEFRMKESTLNVDDIVHWIILTQSVVNGVSMALMGNPVQAMKNADMTLLAMEVEKIIQTDRQKVEDTFKSDGETLLADFYRALNFSKLLIRAS